jgi:hypothetical protein
VLWTTIGWSRIPLALIFIRVGEQSRAQKKRKEEIEKKRKKRAEHKKKKHRKQKEKEGREKKKAKRTL